MFVIVFFLKFINNILVRKICIRTEKEGNLKSKIKGR